MGKAGSKRHKLGKIAIVLFLTVLIWVWADLELDETPPERGAVIQIDESANEAIWVSFGHKASIDIRITLSGPHTAFLALDRELRSEGRKLAFVFDAEQEHMAEAGKSHSLRVLDFVQQNKRLKDLGLKVESCVPEIIDVNVVALVEKSLVVECFDDEGASVKALSDPAKVTMFVPDSTRTAKVQLSRGEIRQARSKAIQKRPYTVLAEGLTKLSPTYVKITMPPETDPLSEETIRAPKLGIALSANLQGKYSVEVTNLNEVMGPIQVKTTATAKQAYESMRYQMILEIDDDDVKQAETRRQVKYNFPEDFVRADEIKINQPPVPARFKLKAIPPPAKSP